MVNNREIPWRVIEMATRVMDDNEEGIYRIYNANNEFVGIGTVKNGILKRDIVI